MNIWDRIAIKPREQGSSEFPAVGRYTVRSGDEVAGCRILKVLGQGSGGIVYLGEQITLERKVAVKMLSPDLVDQDDLFHERFLREARTSARLTHPNIVQVYNATIENGRYFIVMEYVDGQTLDVFLEDGTPLPPEASLPIFQGISEGLKYAHALGIVHRDIKPGNVMIGKQDEVKLMDFGLAKVQGSVTLTAMGAIVGTPHYVPPEICRGEKADFRSDIYSLGATFYHVLTGHWLFPGETPITVMIKQLKEDPVSLRELRPDLPLRLSALVMKMLWKDPSSRCQSAQEVLDELRAARQELEHQTAGATPEVSQEPDTTEERRLPRARLMCLTGALKGRKFPLSLEGKTTVGRLSENSIAILHPTVSRRHCVIEAKEGSFVVRDMGSINGCTLNGKPITGARLSSGDILRVGDIAFEFRALSATEDAHDLAGILVEDGLLSDSKANEILGSLTSEWQKGSVESLGQFLIKRGVLTPEKVDEALEKLNEQAISSMSRPGEEPPEGAGEIVLTQEMMALKRSSGERKAPPEPGSHDKPPTRPHQARERSVPEKESDKEATPVKDPLSVFDDLELDLPSEDPEEGAGPVSLLELKGKQEAGAGPPGALTCIRCGRVVLPSEIERRTARVVENRVLCPNCASSQW
jgi:serine/threonine protein kinase